VSLNKATSDKAKEAKEHYERVDKALKAMDDALTEPGLNAGEIREALSYGGKLLSKKIRAENPNKKPNKYFSLAVGMEAAELVLNGISPKDALIKASKDDGFTESEIVKAKKLKFYFIKDIKNKFKSQIDQLSKDKFINKNHLNWCKTLPQVLDTLTLAYNNQRIVQELERQVKDLNLKLKSIPNDGNETIKQKAIRLKKEGYQIQEIADMTGKHISSVKRYIKSDRN
jgi:hypothetical protein